MTLIDLLVLAMAAHTLVSVWLQDGGLFESWRDWLRAWATPTMRQHSSYEMPTRWSMVRMKIAYLAECRFCLTCQACFWLLVLFWLPGYWLPAIWGEILYVPVYALAAACIASAATYLMDALEAKAESYSRE